MFWIISLPLGGTGDSNSEKSAPENFEKIKPTCLEAHSLGDSSHAPLSVSYGHRALIKTEGESHFVPSGGKRGSGVPKTEPGKAQPAPRAFQSRKGGG